MFEKVTYWELKGNYECTKSVKVIFLKGYNVYVASFILTLHHKLNCFVGNSVLIPHVMFSCIMWFWFFFFRHLVLNEMTKKNFSVQWKRLTFTNSNKYNRKQRKYSKKSHI